MPVASAASGNGYGLALVNAEYTGTAGCPTSEAFDSYSVSCALPSPCVHDNGIGWSVT